jgi:hypothetical protein
MFNDVQGVLVGTSGYLTFGLSNIGSQTLTDVPARLPWLSTVLGHSGPASTYWYYCVDAKSYYPYTQQCPGGWLTVVPSPVG